MGEDEKKSRERGLLWMQDRINDKICEGRVFGIGILIGSGNLEIRTKH